MGQFVLHKRPQVFWVVRNGIRSIKRDQKIKWSVLVNILERESLNLELLFDHILDLLVFLVLLSNLLASLFVVFGNKVPNFQSASVSPYPFGYNLVPQITL